MDPAVRLPSNKSRVKTLTGKPPNKSRKKHGKRSSRALAVGLQIHEMIKRQLLEYVTRGSNTPSVKTLLKDIPYFLPSFGKTTQYIQVRLYTTVQTITTSVATAYTSVLNIQANLFNNFTDFAGIFDEYRVLEGEINYMPTTTLATATWSGANGACVAAIDYGISTALGSTTAAVSHDNKRFFRLVQAPGDRLYSTYGVAKWPVKLEKLPDQDWLLVSNGAQNFAYWKPYMAAVDSPGAGATGYVWGWMDFQFRGMSA